NRALTCFVEEIHPFKVGVFFCKHPADSLPTGFNYHPPSFKCLDSFWVFCTLKLSNGLKQNVLPSASVYLGAKIKTKRCQIGHGPFYLLALAANIRQKPRSWRMAYELTHSLNLSFCTPPSLPTHVTANVSCTRTYWGFHRQGYCQAGFSAALAEDGQKVFVGAPGSWYWQGQVYSKDLVTDEERKTRESPASDDDSFLGYSAAAGEFTGDSSKDVVVGMPRGSNLTGKAVLYSSLLRNLQNISGEQMGSYFGYSVCVSDVNGDGLDDIVVGAPFFTDLQSKESKYEEGRVYVHYQDNKHHFDTDERNFAVGAPYAGKDGKGVLYIYHGSASGVRDKPSQVITPEEFPGVELNTLGFAVSGSMDMDSNEYPDIVLGAYDSERVIFMKTRPVVNITSSMKLSKDVLSLEDKTCALKDKTKVACVEATLCLMYNGLGVASEIDLALNHTLDGNLKSPRALFMDAHPYQVSSRTSNIRLRKNVEFCNKTTVYIQVGNCVKETSLR
ncbi:Integrin alpha-PS2, partial [Araneus ventricosus]